MVAKYEVEEGVKLGGVIHWNVKKGSKYFATFRGPHAKADAEEHAAKCNEREKPKYWVHQDSVTMENIVRTTDRAIARFYSEQMAYEYCDWLNSKEPQS